MSDCPRIPHIWTEGDTFPGLTMTLNEFDLTGYTVELLLRRPDNSLLTKAATIDSATPDVSKFSVTWATGDLQAGVGQEAAIRFTLASVVEHSPGFIIDVRRAP